MIESIINEAIKYFDEEIKRMEEYIRSPAYRKRMKRRAIKGREIIERLNKKQPLILTK